MRTLAAAALLVASTARADVTAEVSAGAGSQAGVSAYGTASATLAAEYSQPSAPLYRRGLSSVDDDSGVWVYTSADDGERDGVRADVSASAIGSRELASAHAAARGIGWELDLGVAYQPVGDLRELYWRSGRGLIDSSIGLEIPPMITFGDAFTHMSMGGMTLGGTSHTQRSGGESSDGGFDANFAVHFIRVHSRHYALDLLDIQVSNYEKIATATAESTTGIGSIDFALDAARLDVPITPALTVTAYGGVANLGPMASFSAVNDPSMQTEIAVPSWWSPRYWLELGQHTDDSTVAVGAGSWARLDPTGNSADTGQLATASYDHDLGRLHLHASAEGGRLVRRLIGALAPADTLAPVGTRMWMGRGELAASLRVAHGFELTGTAWLERSDRDDPRWLVPATGALATHAGADVSARWQLRRHHGGGAAART